MTRRDVKEKAIALMKTRGEKVLAVRHIHLHAYCLASEGYFAVFAIHPHEREPQVSRDQYTTVHDETAATVQAGQWAVVAYIKTETSGFPCVLEVYQCDI